MDRWLLIAALVSTGCTSDKSTTDSGSGSTDGTDTTSTDTDSDPSPTKSQCADRHVETSSTFNGVYSGGSVAWVVGTGGVVYQVADTQALSLATSLDADLQGVWGTGDAATSHIIAVGAGGSVLDYSVAAGFTPSDVGTANLHDVDGPEGKLTAVGWGGVYQQSSGVWIFEQTPASRLNSLKVGTATDFAVGQTGEIIVRTGGGLWGLADSGTTEDLNAVTGISDQDVWAVGGGGTILHWDGALWTPYSISIYASTGNAKGFVKSTDLAAADHVFAGTLWGAYESDTGDLFVVGDNGFAAEIATAAAPGAKISQLTTASASNLYAVTGTSSLDVWAVGNRGTVLRYQGPIN